MVNNTTNISAEEVPNNTVAFNETHTKELADNTKELADRYVASHLGEEKNVETLLKHYIEIPESCNEMSDEAKDSVRKIFAPPVTIEDVIDENGSEIHKVVFPQLEEYLALLESLPPNMKTGDILRDALSEQLQCSILSFTDKDTLEKLTTVKELADYIKENPTFKTDLKSATDCDAHNMDNNLEEETLYSYLGNKEKVDRVCDRYFPIRSSTSAGKLFDLADNTNSSEINSDLQEFKNKLRDAHTNRAHELHINYQPKRIISACANEAKNEFIYSNINYKARKEDISILEAFHEISDPDSLFATCDQDHPVPQQYCVSEKASNRLIWTGNIRYPNNNSTNLLDLKIKQVKYNKCTYIMPIIEENRGEEALKDVSNLLYKMNLIYEGNLMLTINQDVKECQDLLQKNYTSQEQLATTEKQNLAVVKDKANIASTTNEVVTGMASGFVSAAVRDVIRSTLKPTIRKFVNDQTNPTFTSKDKLLKAIEVGSNIGVAVLTTCATNAIVKGDLSVNPATVLTNITYGIADSIDAKKSPFRKAAKNFLHLAVPLGVIGMAVYQDYFHNDENRDKDDSKMLTTTAFGMVSSFAGCKVYNVLKPIVNICIKNVKPFIYNRGASASNDNERELPHETIRLSDQVLALDNGSIVSSQQPLLDTTV